MSLLIFVAGLAALLATPGPTNTLLFAAGAIGSVRAAPRLLAAEAAAYLAAVIALGTALQPVIAAEPRLGLLLQAAAALYLMIAARRMWRLHPGHDAGGARLVTAAMVAQTTLFNPKTLIIAFGLMPSGWVNDGGLATTCLALLAVVVPAVGGLWFLSGHLCANAAGPRLSRLAPRLSAVTLACFALLLARSALAG